MEDVEGGKRKRWRLWLALTALVVLLAVVLVPPMVSINRYKNDITHLVSESLGRPVRLSSVELRLIPRPGFVLTDLTVDEDPAYGAEPVLRANAVKASIRLFSLWRGRLEISRISVDEASINLVRTAEGRWNLESLFRTAAGKVQNAEAAQANPNRRVNPFPYIEATNSRINFKEGVEKLPFSLLNTDLSFWQEQPGEWRIRVRGQPARTDVNLDLADTGVVRLEASIHRAAELRNLPVHLDVDWQNAQLGQLTRLLIGSDSGWRGDLTGEMHLDGTAEAAQIQTRLRATGVHREEFAPAAPMDFDASCGLVYHYSQLSVEDLKCDSPLGDGRIRIAGGMPGNETPAHFSVELDQIPVGAALDALRTVRNDFAPGLQAAGLVSGKIGYAPQSADVATTAKTASKNPAPSTHGSRAHAQPAGPLTGSLTVLGFQLSGDGIGEPVQVPKVVLEAVSPAANEAQGDSMALQTSVALPAGAPSPLTISARLALSGYTVRLQGQTNTIRARELAHVAGFARAEALDALAGGPINLDLSAQGPWLPAPRDLTADVAQSVAGASAKTTASDAPNGPVSDRLLGTVTVHNATWKADYLANPVEIAQATLHLDRDAVSWDPVSFAYGAVKGTASVDLKVNCQGSAECAPHFDVRFGDLDAGVLEAAFLGAREPGTLLSELLAKLRSASSSNAPKWPPMEGTASADSLILGPVTLTDVSADLRLQDDGAEIEDLNADLLGGHVESDGTVKTGQGSPVYALEANFAGLKPAALGKLIGQDWRGGDFAASGKMELGGFAAKDLAASAKGTLHFDWRHGAVGGSRESATDDAAPAALAKFDRWTADAEIGGGAVTLKQNEVQAGSRKRTVQGALLLSDPPRVSFAGPKPAEAAEANQ